MSARQSQADKREVERRECKLRLKKLKLSQSRGRGDGKKRLVVGTIFTHYRTHEQTRKASSHAGLWKFLMELLTRFELVTSSLPRGSSTPLLPHKNPAIMRHFGNLIFVV